jgi:membrane-bound metal-dependent hydrolase YbcI (DUF457 family)
MTVFEHAMVGINGAMAADLHRRHGWPIVAIAGFTAILPDWDGLTILFGPSWYSQGHRVWGHNLLVAGLLGLLVSALAHRFDAPTRIQQWLGRHWRALALAGDSASASRRSSRLPLWLAVGVLATYSHLLADIVFSAGRDTPVWGVPVGWPFSRTAWAYPLVPWGDLGATVIFIAGMFAMVRWHAWTRTIAASTLALVVGYVMVRGCLR